jgi:pyruvate/2-oxoglutarate dehydrogenase complex dihydrolipoamide acyltransferase (E2) component
MSDVAAIIVPQLNVNDETVLLGSWLVQPGAAVATGEPICEVETSKATMELEAEHSGVVLPVAAPQSTVRVGDQVGWIGPSLEAIEAHRAQETAAAAPLEPTAGPHPGGTRSTPRARSMAAEHGVDLEQVAAMGVVGAIKEADVQRYLDSRSVVSEPVKPAGAGSDLPPALLQYVEPMEPLSRHELFVAESLRESIDRVVLATIDAEVELTTILERVRAAQAEGTMLTLFHVVLCALGRTLPHFPRLTCLRRHQELYRYRALDVAFVVRSVGGLLYTPVLRHLDGLGLEEVARACHTATMRVNRGRIQPEELEGACFTVSHVAAPHISRFVALPNRFQSAILAVAGERSTLALRDGQVVAVPLTTLTLSYDHALCDGVYAADFLAHLIQEMERVVA